MFLQSHSISPATCDIHPITLPRNIFQSNLDLFFVFPFFAHPADLSSHKRDLDLFLLTLDKQHSTELQTAEQRFNTNETRPRSHVPAAQTLKLRANKNMHTQVFSSFHLGGLPILIKLMKFLMF